MRTKLIFLAALAMGLLTTFLFVNYMKKYDTASTANTNLTAVVAAKQPIKKNQKINADMLEVIQVPKSSLHEETIRNTSEAVGKFALTDFAKNEVLLSHHLQTAKDESQLVSRKVQDGYRAVAVGANLVRSVSNLIEPEDNVDVAVTTTDKPTGQVNTAMVLENVRVLAVGRRMVESGPDAPYVEYSSVTLQVAPQDELNLVNANEKGIITLILHSRVTPAASPAPSASPKGEGKS